MPTSPSTPLSTITPPTAPEATSNIAAIGGGVAGAVLVAAIIGFFFYRQHRQTKANNRNIKDDDGVGLSLREPQSTNGYRRTGHATSHPPSLAPRPTDDRGVYFSRLTVFPPTSPLSGPQSLLRDPHGHPRFSVINGDKSEWVDDNDDNNDGHEGFEAPHLPQRPPMPARISHQSDRSVTASGPYQNWPLSNSVDIDINKLDAQQQQLLSPRNPQTPGSDGQYYALTTTQSSGPRGPQLRIQTNDSVQDVSARTRFVDRNQYLGRSQELARMMEAIHAEQEELERSRLEYEAQMKNLLDPRSSPSPGP